MGNLTIMSAPASSFTLAAPPRGKPPAHLADLSEQDRRAAVIELGHPAFRANQLSVHYFRHFCAEAEQMSDLPQAVRGELVEALLPQLLHSRRVLRADGGRTLKTLWRLHDGARIESVLMRYPGRTTLCVSSQAGCGMACPFCATGQLGLQRNLSAAEIVEQARLAERSCVAGDLAGGATRLTNVVFMGMGEPLANYRAVRTAVDRLIEPAPAGFGLSARNITISTCGLVPGIDRLAGEGLPVTLAVSLHAPDDALRDRLVPVNTRWPVAQVLDAARRYFDATGRRVSIEYALIGGVNDDRAHADHLAHELSRRGRGWAHVNPIPLNSTPGSSWSASSPATTEAFVELLRARGITTTLRDSRGQDIDGACGQLAAEEG